MIGSPLLKRFSHVMCHISHCGLHVCSVHVHTPSLYMRNGLTDRAQICCVVGSLLVTRFSHVMGHIPHCGLHGRRYVHTPHLYLRNGLADCAQICCTFVTQSVCAVGGLRGLRLVVCVWRFAFGGLRFAVCGWSLAVDGWRCCFTVGALRLPLKFPYIDCAMLAL